MNNPYFSSAQLTAFDGETETPDPNEKRFSQNDVDRLMMHHRKGLQDRLATAEAKTNELEATHETALERLRSESEAATAQAVSDAVAELTSTNQAAISEWQTKYSALESRIQSEAITRELTTAATAGDAISSETVLAILKPHTTVTGDKVTISIEGFSFDKAAMPSNG